MVNCWYSEFYWLFWNKKT